MFLKRKGDGGIKSSLEANVFFSQRHRSSRGGKVSMRYSIGVGFLALLMSFMSLGAPGVTRTPAAQSASTPPLSLDFEFFKTRVEPIFLKRRSPDHARCYACHELTKHPSGLRLQSLSPGNSFWTEEQSRLNFETVLKLVVPGDLSSSMFPMHPLAPESGGDSIRVHSGGRQFASQDDPDFHTIADWIGGKKASASLKP